MMPWSDVYVGTPFVPKGRTRAGWDCWGLVVVAYRELAGVILPAWTVDACDVRTVSKAVREEAAAGDWRIVPAGEEKPLDVVVMRSVHESGHAGEFHVGLVVRPGLVLHCEQDEGTVCLPYHNPSIAGRIRRFHRHRLLESA